MLYIDNMLKKLMGIKYKNNDLYKREKFNNTLHDVSFGKRGTYVIRFQESS